MGRITEWVGDHPNAFASCGSTALILSLVIGADDVGMVILSFAAIVLAFWLFCMVFRPASIFLLVIAAFILGAALQLLLWAVRAWRRERLCERGQPPASRGENARLVRIL
jgi:hypothetical protein